MPTIHNDHALREAINALAPQKQRVLGAQFAQQVSHLTKDDRIKRAIASGLNEQASPAELGDAYKDAKAYATKTYTDCGKDTDWLAQADHFVAAAIAAALTPESLQSEKQSPAWKAAMQARMAVNCTLIELDDAPETSEAEHQYGLANAMIAQG